ARAGWIALVMVAGGAGLAASAMVRKSVTVDEFAVLPHGLAILQTGDFHLDPGIPPLASELSALPLLPSSAHLDTASFADTVNTWQSGGQFMQENRDRYHRYFLYGRLVPLGLLALTCLLAYGFARSLYGAAGGLVTAAFVCFAPNLLAHGVLVTPDIFVTAALIGSLWAFDGLVRRPGWKTATALGIALGAASLAKFTGLLLFGIYTGVLVGLQVTERRRRSPEPGGATSWRKTWLAAALAGWVGLVVINLGYRFAGSFTPLQEFPFKTRPFQWLQQTLPGGLPVPLPFSVVRAMDTQLAEEGYVAYLWGEFNQTGFVHYYLVGLLVKTPLPVLALCLLAFLGGRRIRRREVPMVVTAGLIFCFFSLTKHKNIGMRYVLFLEPVLAVWLGRLATLPWWTSPWFRARIAWATLLGAAWV